MPQCHKCKWNNASQEEKQEHCINCDFKDITQSKGVLSFNYSDDDKGLASTDFLETQIDPAFLNDDSPPRDLGYESFYVLLYELRKLTKNELIIFVHLATRSSVTEISKITNIPKPDITIYKHKIADKSKLLASVISFKKQSPVRKNKNV